MTSGVLFVVSAPSGAGKTSLLRALIPTDPRLPGPNFEFDPPNQRAAQIFFSVYFAMTGMHALHMVIGGGIMLYLLVGTLKGRFSAAYYTPVEIGGLYWHFVDIIWIFLYPLLYLV